ncbi:GGDEF domain-containing protein [Paenibacillus arenilitoris]|uniref:GGDEF domain-containing protein n=1 Tax=Paenibacillus arenilitoris TaxID=2772299 RepID=A0A927CQC4_9BACL|nr:GGDEF domain-containing protein [Paenibacillus arenilitoris]MBD2871575.1 GGDEF domain-containing protein [Paenibacillus arenilitoris]
MDEVGVGLFNRDMIRSIKDRWHNGGIGVIYVSFGSGNTSAEPALQHWESGERGLFWRQRLETDCFYLFGWLQKGEPVARLTALAEERLRRMLRLSSQEAETASGEDVLAHARIGMAVAYPPITGRSTETVIYRMLLEAMEQSGEMPGHGTMHSDLPKDQEAQAMTANGRNGTYPAMPWGKSVRIGELAVPFPIFPARAKVSEVAQLFDANAKAQGAVIVDQGRPIGILMKEKLHQMLAGQFGLPLYWNKPVVRIMNDQPLIVDEQLPVEQVSQLAMAREFSQLYDVVLITKEGRMAGAASIRSILECMTAMRTEAARGANPLTGLPGNEGIRLELRRKIAEGRPFAVIYADLDYFKWYNDFFGFALGDDLIRYLAAVLRAELERHGSEADFVGHIGGDDFIAVTGTERAETLCRALIERFDGGIKAFYGGVEVKTVEDRHGNRIEQEGVTLSLSLMLWDGEVPLTPEYISKRSAVLKKQAKAVKGSAYVMDHITGTQLGEGRQ